MPKNTRRTSASGATWSQDTACGVRKSSSLRARHLGEKRGEARAAAPPHTDRSQAETNSFQLPDHVAVLVHQRVPARDVAHALPEAPPSRVRPAFSIRWP